MDELLRQAHREAELLRDVNERVGRAHCVSGILDHDQRRVGREVVDRRCLLDGNGFVIGPLIAAMFIAVWDIASSATARTAEKTPEAS